MNLEWLHRRIITPSRKERQKKLKVFAYRAFIEAFREDPKEIEGKQALFVVNLAPKKMAGELTEGMLFDIGYADGIVPVLAQPEKTVPNGTRVG